MEALKAEMTLSGIVLTLHAAMKCSSVLASTPDAQRLLSLAASCCSADVLTGLVAGGGAAAALAASLLLLLDAAEGATVLGP